MARSSLADRLYRGEANLNIVGRRKTRFAVAAIAVLIAVGGFLVRGFELGIEFSGGTQIIMPASIGTQAEAEEAVERAIATANVPSGAEVSTVTQVGTGPDATFSVRTTALSQPEADAVKAVSTAVRRSRAESPSRSGVPR